MGERRDFITVMILMVFMITAHVSAEELVKPQIDLNGQFRAISWVFSDKGEKINTQTDRDLTIIYTKNHLSLNSYVYEVNNRVNILPGTSSDKYKGFWSDSGYLLVIEIYVSEEGIYKLDKGGNPVKSVSSYSLTKENNVLTWKTVFPGGVVLTRKYERVSP